MDYYADETIFGMDPYDEYDDDPETWEDAAYDRAEDAAMESSLFGDC